jgi:hypothetical protein
MTRSSSLSACLLVGLAALLSADSVSAANPERLWVAWLDAHSIQQAQATKAVLLDRFPDAVIVADEGSALALGAAGFRVEPPVLLDAQSTVTLLRARRGDRPDADALAAQGARLVWSGGADGIAVSDGPIAAEGRTSPHTRKALRAAPLRVQPEVVAGKALTTDFAPNIQSMVDQVSGATLMDWIGKLAGSQVVTVGASPVTFTTRSTPTVKCDQAEQYVYERFLAMGFTDVQYDPYTFGSTSARNVVATLPGVETPGHVIVLGAHLDSTSPQSSTLAPGANDNASGVAGLLLAAQILRGYSFRSTIRFIAFTGEEQGIYGSAHYADAALARGDSIDAAVIYDMIAWHNALFQIDIEGEPAWLPVMNVMNDACARYTSLATQIKLSSWGSDHVSFQDDGYPSFLAIESEYESYPCYHQTCDTTGMNQPALGAEVAKAGLATVAQLAGPRDLYISHTPLASTENTAGPYPVVATISKLSPLVADSLLLHWSGGGAQGVATLAPTGVPNQYRADIPGRPATSRVTYWLGAADVDGRHAFHPAGAPAAVNAFYVGSRSTLFSEGFESGAAGWTHGGTGDDWQFAAPAGLGGDPAAAFAGTRVAGTDLLGLGATSGHYENACDTWLESPAVNCSTSAGVQLSFARWLGIERSNGGSWDYARVQVNGTTVWQSPSDANLIETAWAAQLIDVSALADGRPDVRLRFTLHSDGSVNYCGWNLDEVRLTGMSTVVTAAVAAATPPAHAVLLGGTPNPAAPGTTLRFELPRRGWVELSVFDVRGRRIRTLVRGVREAGPHALAWDGRTDAAAPCPAGVYFCRLTTADGSLGRTLVLLR